ncbi:hypothetical protein Scep_007616 [Stephania cephalantha]|uniref:Uncharacterized protein n=1 Tax=Stephania cephalantha TaxID=152367 RepID=A0AAP0KBX7_9MAGN
MTSNDTSTPLSRLPNDSIEQEPKLETKLQQQWMHSSIEDKVEVAMAVEG